MLVGWALALVGSNGILLALPLLPALLELRQRRDAGPLQIRKDDGNIRNFALAFRQRCAALEPALASYAALGMNQRKLLPDGSKALFLGTTANWQSRSQCDLLVLSTPALQLPEKVRLMNDLYGQREIRSGKDNVLRAALGEKDIVLAEGTQVARWIHAEGSLTAGPNCGLFGRASAEHSITLSGGCTFERVFSPVIYSSESAKSITWRKTCSASAPLMLDRRRCKHDNVRLAVNEEHYGDIVSAQQVRLELCAKVIGNIKANGDAKLGKAAEVEGSLVSAGSIRIGRGGFVKGPVVAEKEIIIDSGVQIGLPDTPTTISAPRIVLAPGSVIHGTLWARVEGRVKA